MTETKEDCTLFKTIPPSYSNEQPGRTRLPSIYEYCSVVVCAGYVLVCSCERRLLQVSHLYQSGILKFGGKDGGAFREQVSGHQPEFFGLFYGDKLKTRQAVYV
jgi:hypothetical protein